MKGEQRPSRIGRRDLLPEDTVADAPPADLGEDAKQIWAQLAPDLESKGLLAGRYHHLFRHLVEALAQANRAAGLVAQSGPVVVGRQGVVVANPAGREHRLYTLLALRLGEAFGITPAATAAIARADPGLDPTLPPLQDPRRLLS